MRQGLWIAVILMLGVLIGCGENSQSGSMGMVGGPDPLPSRGTGGPHPRGDCGQAHSHLEPSGSWLGYRSGDGPGPRVYAANETYDYIGAFYGIHFGRYRRLQPP